MLRQSVAHLPLQSVLTVGNLAKNGFSLTYLVFCNDILFYQKIYLFYRKPLSECLMFLSNV